MKKIILAMTVLTGIAFSSCSNEDIEVTTVGKKYNVACTINTQSIYDTFELSQEIRDNYLRKKTMGIGITAYLYDSDGKLIESPRTECNFNLNPVSITFENLLEGDYTIVCVETLVNPDDDFKSEYEIIDIESLSTIALQHDVSSRLIDDECVGIGTKQIHMEKDNQSVNIVPEVIGSRIRCFYYNFVGSEYTQVGVGTDVGIDRYFFDPSLSEEDHYYYGYQDDGQFHTIHSMNSEDTDQFHGIAYVLDRDWEWYNCYRTAKHESGRWSTYKARKAELERGKEYFIGFYNLDKLGATASILCNTYEELQDFVKECEEENIGNTSIVDGYHTPFYDWDKGTVSNVKSYMKAYNLTEDITASNLSLTYFNDERSEMYEYYFTNVTNGLYMSSYYTVNITTKDACAILEEGNFILLGEDEDGKLYISLDFRTAAMVEEEDGVVCVTYMDTNSLDSNQRAPKVIAKQIHQTKSTVQLPKSDRQINIEEEIVRMSMPVKYNSIKLMEISK